MNERWVCKRCFSSNDGNLGACANCGLARADSVVSAFLETECIRAFDAYVGLVYAQSALDIFPLVPSESGWDAGDHAVQCALFDPIDKQLTASMRNVGR